MNAAQGDDDDRATAWLPNELWMAIMRAVPVTGDIEGMRALWALRGVSRKWRALVDATLVVFFQDFELVGHVQHELRVVIGLRAAGELVHDE